MAIESVFVNIALVAMALMMFVVSANAFLRHVLDSSIPGTLPIVELLLLPPLVYLVAPSLQEREGNVAVTIVSSGFPTAVDESIKLIWKSVSIVIFAAIVHIAFVRGWEHLVAGTTTSGIVEIPAAPPWLMLAIGFGLLCVRLGIQAYQHGVNVVTEVRG